MKLFAGILAGLCLATATQAQTVPSIEDYAAMPNMSSVRISPNGERVVFISGETRADRNIIVTSLVGGGSNVIDGGDDQVVVGVSWLSDNQLTVTYSDRRDLAAQAERVDVFRTYVMRTDGTRNWELSQYASLANRNLEDPDNVLVWMQVLQDSRGSRSGGDSVEGAVGLFRQSFTRDRARSRVFIGDGGYQYILNRDNEPVVRYTLDGREFELWSRRDGGGWRRVYSENLTLDRFRFGSRSSDRWVGTMSGMSGLDETGRYGYFISRVNDNRNAAFRFDFETEEIEGPIIQSDTADVQNYIRDWRNNTVIGVRWSEGRNFVHYFDQDFADLQTQVEGFFPRSNVTIVHWDAEFRKVILQIEGGHTSGAYYLIDRITGEVALLSASRPRISDDSMSPVEIVHFEARDGLDMFGYLTLPLGREARDLPMIVLPHGGPQARDYYGYDEWSQLLASRGYAVFQPQFRGSDGFGRDFVQAGHDEWGESMQDDVSDSVLHLADQGIIDRDRVCIFGWSYGGYAALAGATLTPELYRCVIAGAPVSDILTMMDYSEERGSGQASVYWADYIGDYIAEREHMISISPAFQAQNVQAPLMLIHGTDDLIVPFEQAEIMARAMDDIGRPYELVAIEDGPHQSYRMTVPNKLELYRNLERFLFEHNPPDQVTN
jgi:dipeptidyl aminopeptidase/acylaminoacyl peptidase